MEAPGKLNRFLKFLGLYLVCHCEEKLDICKLEISLNADLGSDETQSLTVQCIRLLGHGGCPL